VLLQGLVSLKNFEVQLAFVDRSRQLLILRSQFDKELLFILLETLSAVALSLSNLQWLAEGEHEKLPDLILRPSAMVLFEKVNLGVDVHGDALDSLPCLRQTLHKVFNFTELFDVPNSFIVQDSQAILNLNLDLLACLCHASLDSCEQDGIKIVNLGDELILEALAVQYDRAEAKWLLE
jgi:hypothetical protein